MKISLLAPKVETGAAGGYSVRYPVLQAQHDSALICHRSRESGKALALGPSKAKGVPGFTLTEHAAVRASRTISRM